MEALDKTWQLKRLNLSDVDVTDCPAVGHLATEHKVVFKIEGNLALNIIEQVGHLLCCYCALLTPNYITGVDSMDKCPDCKVELSEVQCKVCLNVIDKDLDEDHMNIAHHSSLFANPKEVNILIGL